jgi:hypothetical protein
MKSKQSSASTRKSGSPTPQLQKNGGSRLVSWDLSADEFTTDFQTNGQVNSASQETNESHKVKNGPRKPKHERDVRRYMYGERKVQKSRKDSFDPAKKQRHVNVCGIIMPLSHCRTPGLVPATKSTRSAREPGARPLFDCTLGNEGEGPSHFNSYESTSRCNGSWDIDFDYIAQGSLTWECDCSYHQVEIDRKTVVAFYTEMATEHKYLTRSCCFKKKLRAPEINVYYGYLDEEENWYDGPTNLLVLHNEKYLVNQFGMWAKQVRDPILSSGWIRNLTDEGIEPHPGPGTTEVVVGRKRRAIPIKAGVILTGDQVVVRRENEREKRAFSDRQNAAIDIFDKKTEEHVKWLAANMKDEDMSTFQIKQSCDEYLASRAAARKILITDLWIPFEPKSKETKKKKVTFEEDKYEPHDTVEDEPSPPEPFELVDPGLTTFYVAQDLDTSEDARVNIFSGYLDENRDDYRPPGRINGIPRAPPLNPIRPTPRIKLRRFAHAGGFGYRLKRAVKPEKVLHGLAWWLAEARKTEKCGDLKYASNMDQIAMWAEEAKKSAEARKKELIADSNYVEPVITRYLMVSTTEPQGNKLPTPAFCNWEADGKHHIRMLTPYGDHGDLPQCHTHNHRVYIEGTAKQNVQVYNADEKKTVIIQQVIPNYSTYEVYFNDDKLLTTPGCTEPGKRSWVIHNRFGPLVDVSFIYHKSKDIRPAGAEGDPVDIIEIPMPKRIGGSDHSADKMIVHKLNKKFGGWPIELRTYNAMKVLASDLSGRLNTDDVNQAAWLADNSVLYSMYHKAIRDNALLKFYSIYLFTRASCCFKPAAGINTSKSYAKWESVGEISDSMVLYFFYILVTATFYLGMYVNSSEIWLPIVAMCFAMFDVHLIRRSDFVKGAHAKAFFVAHVFLACFIAPLGEELVKSMPLYNQPDYHPFESSQLQPSYYSLIAVIIAIGLALLENIAAERGKLHALCNTVCHVLFLAMGFKYGLPFHIAYNCTVQYCFGTRAVFMSLAGAIAHKLDDRARVRFGLCTEFKMGKVRKGAKLRIAAEIDVPCTPKDAIWCLGRRLYGRFRDLAPFVFKSCPHNALKSICERHAVAVHEVDEYSIYDQLKPFYNRLVKKFKKHGPLTFAFSKWVNRYPVKIRQLLHAMRHSGIYKSYFVRASFIKIEKAFKRSGVPRLIQGLSRWMKTRVGPYTAACTKMLAKITFCGIAYTCGMNAEQLGAAVERGVAYMSYFCSLGDSIVILEIDMSRFDAHVRLVHFDLTHEFMEEIGCPKSLIRVLDNLVIKRGYANGNYYEVKATMDSGHGYTSFMNSMLNMMMIAKWLNGARNRSFVSGDDSLIIMLKSDYDKLGDAKTAFATLGFKAKIKQHKSIYSAEFCSSHFYHTTEGLVAAPKVFKFSYKAGWTIKNYTAEQQLWWRWQNYYASKMINFVPVARIMHPVVEKPRVRARTIRFVNQELVRWQHTNKHYHSEGPEYWYGMRMRYPYSPDTFQDMERDIVNGVPNDDVEKAVRREMQ